MSGFRNMQNSPVLGASKVIVAAKAKVVNSPPLASKQQHVSISATTAVLTAAESMRVTCSAPYKSSQKISASGLEGVACEKQFE